MKTRGVVVRSQALDDDLCLLEPVEDFSVEQFVHDLRVEAFQIAILPRAAPHNVGCFGTEKCNPLPHSSGVEFRIVVGTNSPRNVPRNEGNGQHFDDINSLQLSLDPDGDEFLRELDRTEHPDFHSTMCAVLYKIIKLDMDEVF